MPEDTMAANTEESVEIANSEVETTTENQEVSGSAEQPQEVAQQEDVTQTQAFSRRLKEETARASEQARSERDQAIAELYGDSHGIKTWDAYQQAKQQAEQQQRAEQLNMDPKLYQEYEGLKQERDGLRHEKDVIRARQKLISRPRTWSYLQEVQR